MEALLIIIWIISVVNFFLFKKAVEKENLNLKKSSINLAYFLIFIFQIFILTFISFAFINIFFDIILGLLLYFNIVYAVVLRLLKDNENKKDISTIVTVRFLKYLVIFEWTVASIIWAVYIFSLLISKM